MRLLSLDYDPIYGTDSFRGTFPSDTSVFDYDIVIWDPAGSFERYHYGYGERYRGLPSLDEGTSVRIEADAKRRRSEFAEFINSGRTLVIIIRPPQTCYLDTGERTYSGTGRNRVTSREVKPFDLLSAIPADCQLLPRSGDRIEFQGDGPVVQLLRKYKKYLGYEAVVSNPPGASLGRIVGTDKVIGSIQRSKAGGYLILLPAPYFEAQPGANETEDDESTEEEDRWVPAAAEFEQDLLGAIEEASGNASLTRPAWAKNYATDEQQSLQAEVVKQQKRVEAARAKLAALQQQKELVDTKDQLFLGTGRALELEVKKVLELLGGTVTEPPLGRDDWRVSFSEGEAVLEVKGVGKSAAEKHAAQLEKWVSSVFEETGRLHKGILVVNSWRELPLNERTQEDFPQQMLAYSGQRNHCLVSGLQLFVIQAEVEKDSGRAEYWGQQLLATSGRLAGADDWRSVIHEIKTED
jgi:hypothetical protein